MEEPRVRTKLILDAIRNNDFWLAEALETFVDWKCERLRGEWLNFAHKILYIQR